MMSNKGRIVIALCVLLCLDRELCKICEVEASWDSYIDKIIDQTKDASGTAHADKACIIGLDGGAKWTTDDHPNAFKLTTKECKDIAASFKSKNFEPFVQDGIMAEGIKYNFLKVEDEKKVFAKKKDHGFITLQASKKAIVIGHCPEGRQQDNLNKGIAVIAEYLELSGM